MNLTPQHRVTPRGRQMLMDAQNIYLVACCIEFWHNRSLQGVKFKVPTLNQKTKRIGEFSTDIKKELMNIIKPTATTDDIDYNTPYQLSRVIQYFATKTEKQIAEFMDGVDKMEAKI